MGYIKRQPLPGVLQIDKQVQKGKGIQIVVTLNEVDDMDFVKKEIRKSAAVIRRLTGKRTYCYFKCLRKPANLA